MLCIEYQVHHTWNSAAKLRSGKEISYFGLACNLIQRLISPNQDKNELNGTLCFVNLLLLVFIYICVFFIVRILHFCAVRPVALFFYFLLLQLMLCIEYQVHHTWNSAAKLCSGREILYFGLARNLIRHLISPNRDELSYLSRASLTGSSKLGKPPNTSSLAGQCHPV